MQCWQCGVTIRPGQKLCVYCGAKLNQDGDVDYDAPADRASSSGRDRSGAEREMRYTPGGGGVRGRRTPEDDGWPPASQNDVRADRHAQRERDDAYRPGNADAGGRDESRPPRRSGGSAGPSGSSGAGGARASSRDPLDDPRAPRNLRGSSSGGRSAERRRGGFSSQAYEDQDYEYDDYNPHDRASPRYQPRFDPDSAEYDAVADQRRQARLRSRRDDSSQAGGYEWDDPRAGRRDEYGRGQRGSERDGGYGSYGGYSETESAEYPASYDNRSGRRDRGAASSRGGWDDYDDRGASAFDVPGVGGSYAPGRDGTTWAQGGGPNGRAPAGAGFGPTRAAAPATKGGRRGVAIALVSLVIVVLLAGGGFLARHQISALLHRGGTGASGAPGPSAFATYTPGPTPTTLPSYKLYANTNAKYIIEYPSAWSTQNQNTTSGGYDYVDLFTQQSPLASVGVESAQAFSNQSDGAIIQGEVDGAKQASKTTTLTFTQIGSDVTVSVGGENWTRRDYNVSANTGVTLHMAILATHHAGRAYAIVLYSDSSSFVKDDSGVFKTILGTFRFSS